MTKSAFDAKIVSLSDLLLNHTTLFFEVPDFQRPYSWDDEQIEQFWDDIYSAWLENRNKSEDKRRSYFFGSMIFVEGREGYWYKYIVIDGQQRLTTLLILLCVVRDLFLKNEENLFDEEFRARIEECIGHRGRFRLKLQPEHHSRFENDILKSVKFPKVRNKRELLELRQKNRYLYVANFFKEKLIELKESMGFEAVRDFLDYILDRVEVVKICSRELSEAIRIFQIVNTRGLDLSPADIIKANLYTYLPEDYRREFKSIWQRIEDKAIDQNRSLTELFTYYVYYRLAPNRPRKAIQDAMSDVFEREYKRKDGLPTNLLYDMEKFVEAIGDVEGTQGNVAILTMKYLPNETYWLTILASAKKENYEVFDELVKEVRKLFYLYWIAGYTSQKVRQLSLDIISMVKSGESVDNIKKTIEGRLEEDDVYRLAIDNLNGDVYSKRWLKPLLLLIEYKDSEPAKTVYVDLKRTHVEHILPREWMKVKYWREHWSKDEAKKWLNRLGNLTLLYSKMNKEIQNAEFPKKIKYYKGLQGKAPTGFLLTRKLFDIKEWTPDEARKRHEWIITEISGILRIPKKYVKIPLALA